MRIFLSILILSLFISCSKSNEEIKTPSIEDEPRLINLSVDVDAQGLQADSKNKTRAFENLELGRMRVVIEAWTKNEAATGSTQKVLALRRELWHTFSSGAEDNLNISMRLFPGEYDFLMWCDYGAEYYNAERLNAVSIVLDENGDYESNLLENEQTFRAAYAARVLNLSLQDDGMSINLMAQSPFAVIQAKQATVLPSSDLPIWANFGEDFRIFDVYDVLEEKPSHSAQALEKPIEAKYANVLAGKQVFLTDYLFVEEQGSMLTFSCQVAGFNLDVADAMLLKPNTLTIFNSNFLDNN